MRIGILGLGNAGQTLHLPAFRDIRGTTVVGGCDPDPVRRAAATKQWRIPVFAEYDALMDEARPDVVVVGTPPETHAQYCIASLERGAHVICEKPFTSSVAEADAVIAAGRSARKQIALNHEFRVMPIFRAITDRAGSPEVGQVRFAQVWQNMDLPPWNEPGWRGRMLQRTLYEAGVHLVDFLMALFGERPGAVSATISSCGAHPSRSDAVALATLEFSGGRLAHVVQNRLCRGETHYFEVRAECEQASLRASFGGRARLTAGLFRSTRPHARLEWGASGLAWEERGTRRRKLARNPTDPGMQATRTVFAEAVRAFRDGSLPPVTADHGRDTMLVVASCYQAAERGTRVTVDATPPEDLRTFRMGTPPPGEAR